MLASITCQDLVSSTGSTSRWGVPAPRLGQPDSWWPVCMPFRVASSPTTNVTRTYTNTIDWMANGTGSSRSVDICSWPKSQNRYSADYVPPSRQDRTLNLATSAQRAALNTEIQEARSQSATTCCGTNADCLRLMNSVRVQWCSSDATRAGYGTPDLSGGATMSDECIENGTYYSCSSEENELRWRAISNVYLSDGTIDTNAVAQLRGHYPFTPGGITLGPYITSAGDFRTKVRVIGHEFGHACSQIKRQIAINEGNTTFISQMRASMLKSSSCNLTTSTRAAYLNLFGNAGISTASSSCLMGVADKATQMRFRAPAQPCENGCPRAFVEENIADWQSMMALDESRWIPTVVPGFCNYLRDAQHPWSWDVMACFVQTPSFADKIKRSSGCRTSG